MHACIAAAVLALAFAGASYAQVTGVGFSTVAEAMDSVRSMPGVEITTTKPDGWTIVNDRSNSTQWSFTPPGHYAHPAVVKRIIKQSADGNLYIAMTALCEAEKASCDKLVGEFEQLNDGIRRTVQRQLQQGGRK